MLFENDVMNVVDYNHDSGLFVVKDADSKIVRASRSFYKAAGCRREKELIDKCDYDFFPEELSRHYTLCDQRAVETGFWSGTELFQGKGFPEIVILTTKQPIYDTAGKVLGLICMLNPTSISVSAFKRRAILEDKRVNQQTVFAKQLLDFSQLTRRELQVLLYIVKGLTAKKVAEILCLSPRTVEYYTESIKNKLNCCNKSELIAKAIENKIFDYILYN